jgi:aerobic-type carbon monoxide dehydrogenase small subunit (CoxS/CutS family)
VNGQLHEVEAEPDEPLLWVLRDFIGLTGTKFGCGEGDCGACSVLIEGDEYPSCQVAVEDVAAGEEIVTIEGLGQPGNLSPVQKAFMDFTAFGCGYCTPGMIISATALLRSNSNPSRDEIVAAMDHHLCRCATYPNILAAIESLAGSAETEDI